MKYNLHTHSTYSDGILSPKELVLRQAEDGVGVMSLTDHDCVDGVGEAIEAGLKKGVKVLPGIELSSYGSFEIHILGYNFDYKNPDFCSRLKEICQLRELRIKKTLEKLKTSGVDISPESLCDETGTIGRLHIAKQMVRLGVVKNVNEAFLKFLGAGKSAHIAGYRLRPFEAVKFIKEYGGVAVLAHPKKIPSDKLELLVAGLVPYGLDGIECYYASHTQDDTRKYLALAKRHNLIYTIGNDYHDESSYISSEYKNDFLDFHAQKKLGL